MNITVPLKVEIKGKATSTYSLELIEQRLAALAGRDDAAEEIEFLQNLKRQCEQTNGGT